MNFQEIWSSVLPYVLSFVAGVLFSVFLFGGGSQSSRQEGQYDQRLENLSNSVVELKNVMLTNTQKVNALINFSRVVVRDNPRLRLSNSEELYSVPLSDEPEMLSEPQR